MDVLKSARRVIRSPSVSKQPWHAAKHKKLPENWTDTRETLVDGMTFNLRYMGMTLVDQPKGEDVSAAAIRRIAATAKAGGKKLLKVSLTVSPQEMLIYDRISNQQLECISIYRMSYCTADKTHNKVFAYIAQNQQNETLECHAFLCAKKKVAQAVTLTVAQAFNLAFESWQLDREDKDEKPGLVAEPSHNPQPDVSVSLLSLNGNDAVKENLLDFDDCPKAQVENSENLENHLEMPKKTENHIIWEVNDGLDEAFSSCSLESFEYCAAYRYFPGRLKIGAGISMFGNQIRLAESCTNPQILDSGLNEPRNVGNLFDPREQIVKVWSQFLQVLQRA